MGSLSAGWAISKSRESRMRPISADPHLAGDAYRLGRGETRFISFWHEAAATSPHDVFCC
jgi:hypothetical protein